MIPKLYNKMLRNVNLQLEALFMLLKHCVARQDNEYRYGTCSYLLSGTIPSPHTPPSYHIPLLNQAYWFHQNVSVQNLNKYVFPDSLDKNMHND